MGNPLKLKQGNWPSFQDEVGNTGPFHVLLGNSGLLSSCKGYTEESLEFHKGSQASFRVVRGNVDLHSHHCRGIGPHLEKRWEIRAFLELFRKLRIPFEIQQETRGSSRVVMDISGNL